MTTIKPGESFTIQEVLNSNGFTLDTTDFIDLLDEDDDFNYSKNIQLNNEEMLKLLKIEEQDENVNKNNTDNTAYVGISFDSIKPKMTSIHGDGEILKLVKVEGAGEVVPSNAQVTIEYVGYFEYQDEPFDSTYFQRDKNIVIRLGQGRVIPGLEISVSSMKKYETSIFIIQPKLAYGSLGCLPRIPPNSEVLFKIRVIDVLDNGCSEMFDELDSIEKKQFPIVEKIVIDLLRTATYNVKVKKITQAARDYNRAIGYLETASLNNNEEEQRMNKLLCRALTNLTVLYNQLDRPKHACAAFERLPMKNGKAYYQHGKALAVLGEYERSMNSLQKAYNLQPESEDIIREIEKVEDARIKYKNYLKRFAEKSLKIVNKTEPTEFEQVVHEMCQSFVKDERTFRQELPLGLTAEELNIIRRISATYNLSITKQARYNVESFYLTSSRYYTRGGMTEVKFEY